MTDPTLAAPRDDKVREQLLAAVREYGIACTDKYRGLNDGRRVNDAITHIRSLVDDLLAPREAVATDPEQVLTDAEWDALAAHIAKLSPFGTERTPMEAERSAVGTELARSIVALISDRIAKKLALAPREARGEPQHDGELALALRMLTDRSLFPLQMSGQRNLCHIESGEGAPAGAGVAVCSVPRKYEDVAWAMVCALNEAVAAPLPVAREPNVTEEEIENIARNYVPIERATRCGDALNLLSLTDRMALVRAGAALSDPIGVVRFCPRASSSGPREEGTPSEESKCPACDFALHDGSVPDGDGNFDPTLKCANIDCPHFGDTPSEVHAASPEPVREAIARAMDEWIAAYPADVWPDAPFDDAQAATVMRAMLPRVKADLVSCCALAPAEKGEPETANERFERMAEEFYEDTRVMAPGKDVPAAMGNTDIDRQQELWSAWCKGRKRASPLVPPTQEGKP